jgi:hypothetical protein
VEINKKNLENRLEKLMRESSKLDSLKNVLYKNLGKASSGSNSVLLLSDEQITNPLDVYKHDLTLHLEILEIKKELYIKPDFEIVDGFTSFKEPESASLIKMLFISLGLSVLFGYLTLGLWSFDRMLAAYPLKT